MSRYSNTLDAAWADHLTPRADDAPTVVSTFAGCGGSSLGYSMAGYRELAAIEWDTTAQRTFRANLPGIPAHGDITTVDPTVLDLAPGQLDVLDGSPPCQGFSTAGRRQVDDPRNQLFREYLRLAAAWQPRVLVMENVSGMVKGPMRALFGEILHDLRTVGPGYRVTARLLDASWLGVPQARKRIIFIGVRSDLDRDPIHPKPRGPRLTVADGLADLPDPGLIEHPRNKAAKLAPHIKPGTNAGMALAAAGRRKSYFSTIRLRWDRPSYVITKNVVPTREQLLHPTQNRLLGTRELARLQSFPDQWHWADLNYKHVHALIGNSVAPLMMRAVATTIRDRILTT